MRALFLNCPNGATPAMLVAALADAGVKPSALEWELSGIELGAYHTHLDPRERDGVSGLSFSLHAGATHGHGDCCGDHHESAEEGRTLADLRALIGGSDLSDTLKARALAVFERLGAAEGAAQQVPAESAKLFEGGTLEGIVQVLSVVGGLEVLEISRVIVSPLREGKGWVQNASGSSVVPSPVTLELLKDAPLSSGSESFQLLPPLAAAILAGVADGYGERPAFSGETKVGRGINPRRFPPLPDIVEAEIGDLA